ncbi:MAG: M23 family metallopeptidase [Longimicrobiaceae bacterium]
MAPDDRRLTVMLIPEGGSGRSTRTLRVPYRRVKVIAAVAVAAVLLWVLSVGSWWYVSVQAARLPGMKRSVERLEAENRQVAVLSEALARLELQYEQVRGMLGAGRSRENRALWLPPAGEGAAAEPVADTAAASLPTSWPLVQSGFVTREHLGEFRGRHPGMDIAVSEGSYIRASGAGRVMEAGEDPVYGRFVRLDHGQGYETLYAHAAELFVEPGGWVGRHEVIALSGSTGTSTAPHLHFEVIREGEPVDPRTVVRPPG